MRRSLVTLHRWFGLLTAVFLFTAGLTGAVIAWHEELDAWLNPELFHVAGAQALDPLELARGLEERDRRLRVRYVPLSTEPGKALLIWVDPRRDAATGKPHAIDFDQVIVHPATGQILGRRRWGEASLARKNVLPFLYKLHYSLHLPQLGGTDTGSLFLGLVAIVWMLDSFIALWISFPSRSAWRKSFAFRLRSGAPKLTFDLHRSGGVWVGPILIMLAVTAVAMNLKHELVRPLLSAFSELTPDFFAGPGQPDKEPRLTREQALAVALAEAKRRGIEGEAGGLVYVAKRGAYGLGLFSHGQEYGFGELGSPWIYIDGQDGRVRGFELPGQGSAGDLFLQAQYPLHSGRILGVFGRAVISVVGVGVAMLSVTGVLLFARRRRREKRKLQRAEPGSN